MKKYISLLFVSLFCITLTTAQVDRTKMPKPGPAPKINLSVPQTFNLPNGLQVLVVENNKLPRARVQLLIDNPLHATGQKAGVENLVSDLMGNGTQNIGKDEFNEEVDFLGANINFGSESAYASSLSKYFPRIMELMADAAKNPLFTQEEFDKAKNRLLDGLKNQEKDVSTVASRVNSALIYGENHPKGEFTTVEKVEKLTLNDVKNFYENYFSPKNAYLVVVGDVKYNEVERLIRQNFADWKSSEIPAVSYSTPKDVQYTQVNFVDMPNAVQSEIAVENLVNLKMSDPDYHAVLIANKVLGGGFNSLLNMNLREKHGWTYGARSSTGADKDITRFVASTSVRNAVTDSAVAETLKEINFIRNNEVTMQELVTAKAKFTGDFVLALERPETVANYALEIKTQDLPKDFYTDYLKKINAVTAKDVKRVANKYYKPENLRIVVVGKGAEVLTGLKTLKSVNGKPIPVTYYDKFGNKTVEPNYNMAMEAGVTADKVLNDYFKALGGNDKLQAVNSVVMKAEAEMQGMMLNLETKTTSKNQSSLVVFVGGNAMQTVVFDGEKGYMMAQGQRKDYDDKENMAAKMEAQPFMELNAKNAKLERVENVDGKDAYVVSFGDKKSAFYDKNTGLKVRETATQEANGQTILTTTNFGDYKAVDGIMFPHKISQSFGPQEIDFNITEIMVNDGVTDADFK